MTTEERRRVYPRLVMAGKCWVWTGSLSQGYGSVQTSAGRLGKVHRMVYEDMVGPIPENLQIDHLCRNRACALPEHLEPVSQRENIIRGTGFSAINSAKTHCPKGHAYRDENLRITKSGHRRCRACHAEDQWRRYQPKGFRRRLYS